MAAVQEAGEQRVVLRNISWETYECLLRDHEDSSAPRFTYDCGTLEIMSPRRRHEWYARCIESLVDAIAVELNTGIDSSFASTTFRRDDLERGFEADAAFYVQNAPGVFNKDTIDPRRHPPPDIVVEIDITHSSIPKLPIYAQFGVPEVWRHDGERLRMLLLEGDRYVEASESRALPGVTADAVSGHLREGEDLDWAAWLRRVREWARGLAETNHGDSGPGG